MPSPASQAITASAPPRAGATQLCRRRRRAQCRAGQPQSPPSVAVRNQPVTKIAGTSLTVQRQHKCRCKTGTGVNGHASNHAVNSPGVPRSLSVRNYPKRAEKLARRLFIQVINIAVSDSSIGLKA